MGQKAQNVFTVQVGEKQLALLLFIERLGYGRVDGIAVKGGEPVYIQSSTQKLDLTQPVELAAAIADPAAGPLIIEGHRIGIPLSLARQREVNFKPIPEDLKEADASSPNDDPS